MNKLSVNLANKFQPFLFVKKGQMSAIYKQESKIFKLIAYIIFDLFSSSELL